jgi:hypothetical protein
MTDLALPAQPGTDLHTYQEANIARLGRWAEQADAAVRIADVVAKSTMCPQAYRGNPNEAAAAILAGAELGFDPMASLRAFDNIQGTPAPKAMTLRAVVQRAGHEIRIVESSIDRCIAEGRRKGDTEWQRSVWDVARAEQMPQYKSNPNWRTNRAAMLVARATSEVCRWIASDAIMGMPYSAEEISDTTGLQAVPSTSRVVAADIISAANRHVEQRPAITSDDGESRRPASEQQIQDIVELLADRGLNDRDTRRTTIEKVIGRAIDSPTDLDSAEAELIIASLTQGGAA